MEMEQQLRYRAWAEIDLSALEHNVRTVQAMLPKQTAYMAVVKANAYGHGDKAICQKLWELGVRWFAVSNLEEALSVRKYCPYGEIFILGYTPPEFAPELARNNIIQGVLSLSYAQQLQSFAHQPVRCHIKLDTGMGRIGFRSDSPEDCARALLPLFDLEKLSIEGIYTHFAVADEDTAVSMAFTERQFTLFMGVCNRLQADGVNVGLRHCCNSAGTLLHPAYHLDMCRLGLSQYGLDPDPCMKALLDVRPAMSLYTVVSMVKEIPAGATVSYGRQYTAPTPRRIATVAIGYADGYPRSMSNRAEMLLHGKRAPVIGRVCMDQLMLDVTDIPEACMGDIAVVAGSEGGESVTFDDMARWAGTINYEIICGISKRVPRVITE